MKAHTTTIVFCGLCAAATLHAQGTQPAAANASPQPAIVLPLDRTAYFVGETVPLAVTGAETVKLEAVNANGRVTLYQGSASAVMLDTARLAPGDYALEVNGTQAVARFTLTSTLRKSAGSMQDEATPSDKMSGDEVTGILKESGLTACLALGASDMGRAAYLDTMARVGALLLVNPETRPTSFFPAWNNPDELDGMSQRMILTAQANARYPNFGGFCYGWDTTGYAVGGRRGLLTYWGWGDKTQALRNYIERVDKYKMDEFTRRTGLKPVSEEEYLAYVLSIGRPEFGTAIDLPTKLWLDEIARYAKPMPESERAAFEKRLDAWSAYLMGLYNEAYGTFTKNLRSVDPALRSSSSVQSDHCAVRQGQYFPSAYAPLDFQYQSTWNDQVGGPDYLFQWLLVDALLEMERGDKPTWISNALGAAHGLSSIPGKFTRVAAHGLAFGSSGIGFSLEGFSNILGGMNAGTNWKNIKGKAGEADLLAGRDFLDRFAALAVAGRGRHGVGILWSKTQYGRQHVPMGFGRATYNQLVALTRLGYTPRFVTEDEITADVLIGRDGPPGRPHAESGAPGGRALPDIQALVVIGQTFALPEKVNAGLAAFAKNGGRILVDGSTTVEIAGAEKLPFSQALSKVGKPHNWATPNMLAGENDAVLYAREYPALAKAFAATLGDTGHAWLKSDKGADTQISLLQLDGGRDAQYIVAVNDSWVANQADWYQVKERLEPMKAGTEAGAPPKTEVFLYDCTDERAMGEGKPFECDLSRTTARVFARLPREIKTIALSATQSIKAGEPLVANVAFNDGDGKRLAAVLPFHLALIRPDGKVQAEFYRSTTTNGTFAMAIPVAANEPMGEWSVAVRSQLSGEVATLPVKVVMAKPAPVSTALAEDVVVRDRAAIEATLVKGASVVLPVFDDKVMPVAEQVKATLAARGVTVDIRQNPATNTYTIGYDPSEAQKQENARADRGEAIGKIKRETINGNDWASALGGWRFGKPAILLDLCSEASLQAGGAGKTSPKGRTPNGSNPMVEPLAKAGMLWPQVSEAFPGKGRAVVQAIPWAFAPRMTALVIQAADLDGLLAGAKALADLPADRFSPGIAAVKTALWQQYHVGGGPAAPQLSGLTAKGLAASHAPRPFVIAFPGDKPLTAEQVKHPEPAPKTVYAVPGTFQPKQLVVCYEIGSNIVETATVEPLMRDLRFSQALKLVADVKVAGKVKITAAGVFRYSDRKPCWQAQWEDVINLREKLVPSERRPMVFEVRVEGKPVGKLLPVKTEQKEVPLELASSSAGLKPKSVVEEVVTELSGEVELPAGRQEIVLIHRNVVDGKLEKVMVDGPGQAIEKNE